MSNVNVNGFKGQSNGNRFKGQSLIKSWLSLLRIGNIYCLSCSVTVSSEIKTLHLAEKLLKQVEKQLKNSFRNSVKSPIYTRSHSAKVNCKSCELDPLEGKTNWASQKTLREEKLQRFWDPDQLPGRRYQLSCLGERSTNWGTWKGSWPPCWAAFRLCCVIQFFQLLGAPPCCSGQ